ncbi:MAG TPA: VWA domain-containing protein [Terracidiphilus sp.]|nr:VWA domain-containing protein [Terracidiphilus sp.]
MRRTALFAAAFCLLLFCTILNAQQFPKPAISGTAASRPPTIHLDVVVKDSSGTAVSGLPKQYFTVLDNGQPQKLVSFMQVDTKDNPSAVHVLIVMDMINLGYNSVTWGREQLAEYLKQEGGSLHYRTSIAAMTEDGLKMMSGSTTDASVLQTEFNKIPSQRRMVEQSAGWQGMTQLLTQSLEQFTQILAIEKTRPGRKMMLFISPGWPMLGWVGSEEDLNQRRWVFDIDVDLTDTIVDARTAIYRLDPFEVGGHHDGDHDPFYYQDFLKPMTKPSDATYPYLGLGVFAIHSGGQVLLTGKDVAGEINSAMRDAGTYYELTYATPPAGGPNKFHAIDVRVNQPGAIARTIAGYYADPQSVEQQAKKKKKKH